jgi:hypothetical protein
MACTEAALETPSPAGGYCGTECRGELRGHTERAFGQGGAALSQRISLSRFADQDNFGTPSSQTLAEDTLAIPLPIDIRGVEQGET